MLPRSPSLRSWSIVGVVALMAAALLVTAWTTYAGVRAASATLVRGQVSAFEQAIRWELRRTEGRPTAEDLQAILEDGAAAGLRYVAVVTRNGSVQIEAGEARHPLPAGQAPPGEPVLSGGRVRVVFPAFPPRRQRDRASPGGPGWVAIELEPLEAASLRAAAIRTFGIGALAATMLLVVAVWLVRAVLRREAVERQLERDRRLSSLGEMSAVLAHEIRNPLASLKGNAQLLAESLGGDDRGRKAARVVEEAERLEALTSDLLAYVRSGGSRREPVDPAGLLRECAARVDGGIEVEASDAPAVFPLDAQRVRQLLVNLLENAVQAGPPVTAAARRAGEGLVFVVRDHGPGVPASERGRIFEPFFTRRTRGTGLGLAVVRRVVEEHGGSVAVEDAPGGGSVFRVTIPPGMA